MSTSIRFFSSSVTDCSSSIRLEDTRDRRARKLKTGFAAWPELRGAIFAAFQNGHGGLAGPRASHDKLVPIDPENILLRRE